MLVIASICVGCGLTHGLSVIGLRFQRNWSRRDYRIALGMTMVTARAWASALPLPREVGEPWFARLANETWRRSGFWATGLVILAIGLYFLGAYWQGTRVNRDLTAYDQLSYSTYAQELARSDWQFVGTRNQMPLYPAILAWWYRPEMTNEAFFATGKVVNTVLGLAVWAGVWGMLCYRTQARDAGIAALVTLLSVFAFRAPQFQAELLYYGLSFALFVLLWRLWERPSLGWAIVAGVVAGLAHLTKASVLPAVLLGAGGLVLLQFWPEHSEQTREKDTPSRQWTRWPLLSAAVLVLAFVAVLSPYLRTSKERYGQYFYNVNSTFYMWCDSWEEAKAGPRASGDRDGWPAMAEEALPGPGKYWREHSLGDILVRLAKGAVLAWGVGFGTLGYPYFLVIYAGLLTLLAWRNRADWWGRRISTRSVILAGLILSYFAGYALLFAWYAPIAVGNRFVLMLFLPLIYVCLRGLAWGHDHGWEASWGRHNISARRVSGVVLVGLGAYMTLVWPFLIGHVDGGH